MSADLERRMDGLGLVGPAREMFRATSGGEPPAPAAQCRHLGHDTGRREEIDTCCAGTLALEVYACAHPVAGPETTLRQCQGCGHFEA